MSKFVCIKTFIFYKVYKELAETRKFSSMDLSTDEAEHSIEMHLPYIAKILERYNVHFIFLNLRFLYLVGKVHSQ